MSSEAQKIEKKPMPGFVRRNLPLVVFLVLAFAFRWSFADQYYVPSGSMEPTVEIGDRILVNKMAFDLKFPYTSLHLAKIGDPNRGDIVVFENPKDGVTMVKRLIGLPGDHLEIKNGFVSINGKPIDGDKAGEEKLEALPKDTPIMTYEAHIGEKTVNIKRLPFQMWTRELEVTVPEDSYFAMGDNRDNSSDSRVWGFIPRDHLKGRAFAVFWSLRFEDMVPHINASRTGQKL